MGSIQNAQYYRNIKGVGYDIPAQHLNEVAIPYCSHTWQQDPTGASAQACLDQVLNNWGQNCNSIWCGDINGDGVVDVQDILDLLDGWPTGGGGTGGTGGTGGSPDPEDPPSFIKPAYGANISAIRPDRFAPRTASTRLTGNQLNESEMVLQEAKEDEFGSAGVDFKKLMSMFSGANKGVMPKMGNGNGMPPMGNGNGMPPMPKMGNGNGKKPDLEMLKKLMGGAKNGNGMPPMPPMGNGNGMPPELPPMGAKKGDKLDKEKLKKLMQAMMSGQGGLGGFGEECAPCQKKKML